MQRAIITDLAPYTQDVDQFDISEEQELERVDAIGIITDKHLEKSIDLEDTQKLTNCFHSPSL